MIRVRDNPAPIEHGGGLRVYYGPALNRGFWRVFELWCYAGVRHRATMSDFWFRCWVACSNVMAMLDSGWVGHLRDPKCSEISERVERRHARGSCV